MSGIGTVVAADTCLAPDVASADVLTCTVVKVVVVDVLDVVTVADGAVADVVPTVGATVIVAAAAVVVAESVVGDGPCACIVVEI